MVQQLQPDHDAGHFNEVLNEISIAITSTLDFDEIMSRALRIARKAMGMQGAVVLLREGDDYVVRYANGLPSRTVGVRFSDSDAAAFAEATRNREQVMIEDARSDPRLHSNLVTRFFVRSLISQPIFLFDEPIGVLVFSNHTHRVRLSDAQLNFCSRLSTLLTLAIHNSRLYSEEQAAKRLADTLAEINIVLGSAGDPEEVIRHVLELAARGFGSERAVVTVREGDRWFLTSGYGMSDEMIGSSFADDMAQASMLSILSRQTVVSEDAYHDERFDPEVMKHFNLRSFVIAPLVVGGGAIGVLSFQYEMGPRKFSDSQVAFASRLATSVSLAYENRKLTESLRQELAKTALLKEIATALSSLLDIGAVARKTLEIAQHYLDARTGSIYYADDQARTVENLAIFGYTPEVSRPMERLSMDWDTNVIRVVRGTAVMTHETKDLAPVSIRRYHAAGLDDHRWFILPLVTKGKTIGALGLSFQGVRSFTADEMSLYRSIAEQLGIAIENARLYEEERRVSQALQEPLLTLPGYLEGVEVGHLYHSATMGTRVGGDFFDVIEIDEGRIGIVIGDVAGKGLEAANLTTLMKSTIRAFASEGHGSAEVVGKTNKIVIASGPRRPFVTVFFGILDRRSGELDYTTAGHPPPLLRHPDAGVEPLQGGDPPVGAFPNVGFRGFRMSVGLGDLIFLYTDGIIEARRENDLYGEERLAKVLKSIEYPAAKEVPEIVFEDVTRFSSGELRDDTAVLVLRLVA